jgi:hypothetical protein
MADPQQTLSKIDELIRLAQMRHRLDKAPVVYGADPQLNLGWVRHWLQMYYDRLAKDLDRACEVEIRERSK